MLKSDRIVLRALTNEDLPTLLAWINDRDLIRHSAPYRPISMAEHQAWFDRLGTAGNQFVFGICTTDDAPLIGTCQLSGVNWIHRDAELQVRIGESSARQKGYGTEAVRLLLQFAFRDLNLRRVSLHVFNTNRAAIRTYEKAGFQHEGVKRSAAYIEGHYVDVVLMGVLRE